jgi:predicted RNA-binding protein YlqC (UPF0109 family)
MNIVEYTSFLVKSLAKESDMVSVKEIGSTEDTINLEVLVKDSDMGIIIGKSGVNAKAIRTMVQAYSYLHDKKRVIINIDSF